MALLERQPFGIDNGVVDVAAVVRDKAMRASC